jgi:sugar phosphate isomerase/epimerase
MATSDDRAASRPANHPLELCCMTVRQASLPDLIELARTNGFASMTTTARLVEQSDLDMAALRRRLDDAGVAMGYVDGLWSPLPGTPGGPTERDCYTMAHALGAPAVNVIHYNGPPVPFDPMADALAGMAERAGREGLRILIEFFPGTGIPDLPRALALIRAIDAPNLSVMLDTWHLARSGGGPALLDGDAPDLVGALQISDRRAARDAEPYVPMSGRDLPGDGDLPLVEILRPVLAVHPGMAVGIEVLNDELLAAPASLAAAQAGEALRALLERVDGP